MPKARYIAVYKVWGISGLVTNEQDIELASLSDPTVTAHPPPGGTPCAA